ncbi:AraC family transcriptional regulator ligand-binding domain-containing protein [Vibrio sp. HN007]|uniref:AraC family transcriptional regulator n=1 Tax=Vibrio iocasae TaxID=3098914 RepID=UPI0035D4B5C2
MGYIATFFALRAADIASQGLNDKQARFAELCKVAGIDQNGNSNQKNMINDVAFFGLLEHIAANYERGNSIAIRVGETMECDDYGAFGLAFKTARDLSGSFQRVERYGKVVTNIANYSVVQSNHSTFMAVKKDANSRIGLLLTNELAVAAATSLCREVSCQQFTPTAVHFSHEAPSDISDHEQYFQCPVIFGSDKDGLEISNDLLFAGNRLGDHAVSAFFDTHLNSELAEIVDQNRIDQRVARHVTQALSEGVPSLNEIAKQLGMSSRTLQRRLSDEGLVYQGLVDDTRRDLAIRLLEKNEYSLAEIAFLTGYSEQSTFTRAFKRWHGQTPTRFIRSMY